jgi:hypothetical protein
MKTVKFEDASHAELVYFAVTVKGIEIKPGTNATQIRSKIRTVDPEIAEFDVPDDLEAAGAKSAEAAQSVEIGVRSGARQVPEPQRGGPLPASSHKNDPTIDIYIPSTKDPGGEREVQVAVNGYLWLIKRDQWITVPYRVFRALENAVETTHEWDLGGGEGGTTTKTRRDTPSYPFNYRNGPSEAEIAAWHQRASSINANDPTGPKIAA